MSTLKRDERSMFYLDDVKNFIQKDCTFNNSQVTIKKK